MGAVALKIGDGTARFRKATLFSSVLRGLMLFSVVITNLFALYAFTYTPRPAASDEHFSVFSDQVSRMVHEIEISQKKLAQIGNEVLGYETVDISKPSVPPELKTFLSRQPLPLGRDARTGITEMVSSVGHKCGGAAKLVEQYMTYIPGSRCPDDAYLAEKLLSRGCEPLPRRRCLSKRAASSQLLPLPISLWAPANQKIAGSWEGSESKMWVRARGKNDFLIDDVLALAKGVRIGFDIGGGVADFAARMAERNVTVVTSTAVNSRDLLAARGLFPLQLTPGQRFPFSDSVFDLVHTGNAFEDDGGVAAPSPSPERMEFFMFDLDRVLRPGGILWLDNFRCADEKAKWAIIVLIEKFGFKKLRLVAGEKVDASSSGKVLLLSAVLQKPVRS